MIAIPAVDLREGACVQLIGGSYADERIRIDDPLAAARSWTNAGFSRLHVVDLDAATGAGSNAQVVDRLIGESGAKVQVGGGVRTSERLQMLIERGAAHVVVGTRAITDRGWLSRVATANPGRIVVAADVRGRAIVVRGWAEKTAIDVSSLVESITDLPLGGILVTAVHCEGLMAGTDIALMAELAGAASVPVIASGGVSTIEELRRLSRCGISAAVLGMSLYTGALDARAVAEEFGS